MSAAGLDRWIFLQAVRLCGLAVRCPTLRPLLAPAARYVLRNNWKYP